MTKNQSSIFRAYNHIAMAKEYFLDVSRTLAYNEKQIILKRVEKLDWILTDTMNRLPQDLRDFMRKELLQGDTLWTEAIIEKMADLTPSQRIEIESIIDYLKNNPHDHPNQGNSDVPAQQPICGNEQVATDMQLSED